VTDKVGQRERKVQERLVKLINDRLGYRYLGSWQDRTDTRNIELSLLEPNLEKRGYGAVHIGKAVEQLVKAAAVSVDHDLYDANREVYELLRYGVKVKPEAGHTTDTVWLIDWANPVENEFVLVEEVTVLGQHNKRPDLVVYVNGIALVTVELKRSTTFVEDGIRQTYGNQKLEFIRPFFSTVQLTLAGNDTQGLRYAPILAPEKYWLKWKLPKDVPDAIRAQIDTECAGLTNALDRATAQMLDQRRLLELIRYFTVFDQGVRKTARPNQYFGVLAGQLRVAAREGGILWHTQGSGKSLTMVWLAKWLRENQPDARVLIITDRTELDEQIGGNPKTGSPGVFKGVGEKIHKTVSGADLLSLLGKSEPWLVCSLVHKFRSGASGDADGGEDEAARDTDAQAFISQLRAGLPEGWAPRGNLFVFVDEAHRTQSGKLHTAMKELLPDAMFIGFTGTPLLKTEKSTSLATFGSFIHTYKFDEAVADGVVLDLRYEARDIEQQLESPKKVDAWFDAKTRGLNDVAKAALKRRWGTLQVLYSAEARAKKIVADIELDMETRPRLMDRRGNALLVTSSIYQACNFYEEFSKGDLAGKCAIVSSFQPNAGDVAKEDAGAGKTELLMQYDTYRAMLAAYFNESEDTAVGRVEQFEGEVKKLFVERPEKMRLLIVVDKLLTGFDAPSATYLYIDKKMRDHGLFQAICRVNRLDGDDKDYGYVVDYRDLFKSLEQAVDDYTGEALDGYEPGDVAGLLTDRVAEARKDLDEALDKVRALVEPVAPPKDTTAYLAYFCGDVDDPEALQITEPRRTELYKSVAVLVRRYAAVANDMIEAGYTDAQAAGVKAEVSVLAAAADEVKIGSGDHIDLKRYEPDMRRLLDTYISAKDSTTVREIGDEAEGIIELIVRLGEAAPEVVAKKQGSKEAAAATIINNVRRLIIDEGQANPKYYDRMSELLNALIEQHKQDAKFYDGYLQALAKLAADVKRGEHAATEYPSWANTHARRALIDFELPGGADVAQAVDAAVLRSKKADWIGNRLKERQVQAAVAGTLPPDFAHIDELMDLLRAQGDYA
jgi:type I restriction enzyme R subunit